MSLYILWTFLCCPLADVVLGEFLFSCSERTLSPSIQQADHLRWVRKRSVQRHSSSRAYHLMEGHAVDFRGGVPRGNTGSGGAGGGV